MTQLHMNQLDTNPELPPCSIAIKCADDPKIERCLKSIDDPTVDVNAVITPSQLVERILVDRGIPYSITEYGNIAKSAQISVEEASHDNVIVMDSDAYFAPGAVRKLREALLTTVVAKPTVSFANNGSRLSRLIAESRRRYYGRIDHADSPGLAIRRLELAESCGYVFNPLIRWTEDADLNYRLKLNKIPLTYVPEAVVLHDPVALQHELKCAFRYGIGKRLSVEHTPSRPSSEELAVVFASLVKGLSIGHMVETVKGRGLDDIALSALWRIVYLGGYHAQKRLGYWTVDEG